ncbi:MAG: proteasome-activating nucleotidase [Candidatus Heimdallarchaeota archaeon]|nr:proteasome-activating nucleotidase [Candidatus Heimdallarchaeota archaeon]
MPTSIDEQSSKDESEGFDLDLINYTRHLERQTRRLETEKSMIEGERLRLQRELNGLRGELERLRAPPLFTGTIMDVLPDDKAIVKSSTGPQLVVNISSKINSKDLKVDTKVALNQRSFSIVDILPTSQDPAVRAMEIETKPTIDYDQIGGLDKELEEVREIVELPLTHPELFEKVGINPPKGVLLHGPPGTGKTLIAKAVARNTNATFIRVIASELVQKFIGEGARLVREIFEFAKEQAPAILFIDELDAVGSKRLEVATSGDREVQRTLMQLLSSLDGFEPRGEVKVIAATNRPDILDPALLRPGRFDRLVEIGHPDENARLEIFKIHARGMNVSEEVDLKFLVASTSNFSGADIRNLCLEAGMFAIRDRRGDVRWKDFLNALHKVNQKKGNKNDLFDQFM